MSAYEDIQKSLKYIEENLNKQLTVQEIAHEVGYSVSHFCKLFRLYQKSSPMDYLRQLRLIRAREELTSDKKMLEIALDYGFETASGFSKAFRKEFGYSPTFYRSQNQWLQIPAYPTSLKKEALTIRFRKKDTFKVAGYGIQTNLHYKETKDIAAYWDKYDGESLELKMYTQLQPPQHGEVGLCITNREQNTVEYLFGVIIENEEKVTAEMLVADIPAAEYIVFTTPPIHTVGHDSENRIDPFSEVIRETWRFIFFDWFPKSGFFFDDTKTAFEFYDERCHGLEDVVMDIFIPIKRKKKEKER